MAMAALTSSPASLNVSRSFARSRKALPAQARGRLVVRAADEGIAGRQCQEKISQPREDVNTATSALVTFMGIEGSTAEVRVPHGTYILNAAERAGIDLPATCRGGICGCCVGKVPPVMIAPPA